MIEYPKGLIVLASGGCPGCGVRGVERQMYAAGQEAAS